MFFVIRAYEIIEIKVRVKGKSTFYWNNVHFVSKWGHYIAFLKWKTLEDSDYLYNESYTEYHKRCRFISEFNILFKENKSPTSCQHLFKKRCGHIYHVASFNLATNSKLFTSLPFCTYNNWPYLCSSFSVSSLYCFSFLSR